MERGLLIRKIRSGGYHLAEISSEKKSRGEKNTGGRLCGTASIKLEGGEEGEGGWE